MNTNHAAAGLNGKKQLMLLIGALGVVFGDIGTSPLYALKECFLHTGLQPSAHNVLSVLSLIIWSLISIVTFKYVLFILKADRNGEGGILSLLQLALDKAKSKPSGSKLGFLSLLGVFGAALLYGDGTITPAISVLSAVEGLNVITDSCQPFVIPITIAILILLFSIQRTGTSSVGKWFGPVTLAWFVAMAGFGSVRIFDNLDILRAFNPLYALDYLLNSGLGGLKLLGSVVLVVTGAEALYADMGHFGIKPIKRAWFRIVFPCLILNYLGQGAFLLSNPTAEAVSNPFFRLLPQWGLIPMVILATMATIVASQALISGAFSLTMQAMQMGYLPRLTVKHTSRHTHGQIYMPFINWVLMLMCVGLVLAFKESSKLAGAYSIAVILTMLITTLLFYVVARRLWNWQMWKAASVCSICLAIELLFLAGNLGKILDGGWFTLSLATAIFIVMITWAKGRRILAQKLYSTSLKQEELIEMLGKGHMARVSRVSGTAVFMSTSQGRVPVSLLHNIKHNHVLHERVIFLTIVTSDRAFVKMSQRVEVEPIAEGFYRVTAYHGYMQAPSIPRFLANCSDQGLELDENKCTFFLGRESILGNPHSTLSRWQQSLFAVMSRVAQQPASYFQIPPGRIIELGLQVQL